ncbi:aromatic amino acid transport family protein [Legionella sp. CNM-4043-24]|uniref:aromatic amino acid transport family protein n=1 Tax=Legionella sp. CNM-4043-24 TaxID=3421646 RepID=UPI00403AE14E
MIKFTGGTLLIIGAIIGGGLLAIPIVSAQFGFMSTLCLIVATWFVMTSTGLFVLSLCLRCPEKYNSYFSMMGRFFGPKAQLATVVLFLWLLYLSLSSSISGCVSLILSHLNPDESGLSYFSGCILFVLLLGSLMVISSRLVVRVNVLLVSVKLGVLLLAIGTVLSNTHSFPMHGFSLLQKGGLSLVMIIINAFGYQFIIPSLVSYYGREHAASFKWMIMVGTTSVMVLYIAWLYAIYSIIPMTGEHGLLAVSQSENQLMALNSSLAFYTQSSYVLSLLSGFETVALFGSFFCVSLGVFDFLVDVFKTSNRYLVGLATFTPPLLLILMSQNMYVYAMSAEGYIAIILEIMIPLYLASSLTRRPGV